MGIIAVAIETFTEIGCVNSVSPAIRALKVKLMEEADHLWNATSSMRRRRRRRHGDGDGDEEKEENSNDITTATTSSGLMRFGDTVRRTMTDVVDMGILACIDDREGDAVHTRLANTSIYRQPLI